MGDLGPLEYLGWYFDAGCPSHAHLPPGLPEQIGEGDHLALVKYHELRLHAWEKENIDVRLPMSLIRIVGKLTGFPAYTLHLLLPFLQGRATRRQVRRTLKANVGKRQAWSSRWRERNRRSRKPRRLRGPAKAAIPRRYETMTISDVRSAREEGADARTLASHEQEDEVASSKRLNEVPPSDKKSDSVSEGRGTAKTTALAGTSGLPSDSPPEPKEALAEIRKILVVRMAQAALDLGEYLLGAYFGGRKHRYLRHKKDKNPSFNKLLEQQDELQAIGVSRSTLYNCIRIYIQSKDLGHEALDELPYTHQVALLSAPPNAKIGLADRAVEEGLSVRKLKEAIKKAKKARDEDDEGNTKRGRTPMPAMVRALAGADRLVAEATREWYDELRRQEATTIKEAVETARGLQELLGEFIEEFSDLHGDDENVTSNDK